MRVARAARQKRTCLDSSEQTEEGSKEESALPAVQVGGGVTWVYPRHRPGASALGCFLRPVGPLPSNGRRQCWYASSLLGPEGCVVCQEKGFESRYLDCLPGKRDAILSGLSVNSAEPRVARASQPWSE